MFPARQPRLPSQMGGAPAALPSLRSPLCMFILYLRHRTTDFALVTHDIVGEGLVLGDHPRLLPQRGDPSEFCGFLLLMHIRFDIERPTSPW